MNKILITGGAGYVGSHTVKELQRLGYSTLVLDNLTNGHRELVCGGDLIEGDLEDSALLGNIFARHSVEAVMHFAALAYVGESVTDPGKYYRNNVCGTLNLVEAMLKARVNKIIFSSTCATYGHPQEIPITEKHLQNPVNPYGSSKLMVERILHDFEQSHGLRSVIFRYFNAAGADLEGQIGEWHEPETHLIPLVLDVAAGKQEVVKIFGTDYDTDDGTCIRDYIHVTDLADAHIRGLKHLQAEKNSDVFNLGNGQGYSVRQVIEWVERITGRKIEAQKSPRRLGDPAKLVGSAEKAQKVLGWKTRFPKLEDIIRTAWKWHQRQHGVTE
jgi:UDP-glucose 4-epimerase